MSNFKPSNQQTKDATKLRQHFCDNEYLVSTFLKQMLCLITEAPSLKPFIHTLKSRIKNPDHLLDKIYRKMEDPIFSITPENLFSKITDLAGIRILHLHTTQIEHIDPALRGIFEEQKLRLVESPFARVWDTEYRDFFTKHGISVEESPTMYTSVHYIVESGSRTPVTCEIQVRTLAEEIWGEVDHDINYPHKIDSVPCKEQIKTLARATSTVTRLVDGIYASVKDIKEKQITP